MKRFMLMAQYDVDNRKIPGTDLEIEVSESTRVAAIPSTYVMRPGAHMIGIRYVMRPVRRMKRSDISDALVLALASEGPGVLSRLVEMGAPPKVALAKIYHMSRRGLINYGVSPNFIWIN